MRPVTVIGLAAFSALLLPAFVYGQQRISGRTLSQDSVPLAGVAITNRHSQLATTSGPDASFTLLAHPGDTILFSGINVVARYWIVPSGASRSVHDILLTPRIIDLMPVSVRNHTYKDDSIANRQEYAKAFNFHRPRVGEIIHVAPIGIAVNINQLTHLAQLKSNRHKMFFKHQLVQYEHEGFVAAHYTERLVASTVPLSGDSLTYFVNKYRPTYEQVHDWSDYDMLYFIHQSYKRYVDSLKNGTVNAPL
ncbi:hypothetical protein DCC81_24245 [Chitinophaga parva]|uniref:Uncharacterized protein n=1 Tax=Chitinophaga parva TaxID=2169414 RepID=A0A2T7BBD5_9BACT|nr:hypothetical protein [Chitinophaga parva]PUZ21705.1 hypothetical protein DCC81_24245 [Chitinophaga parva]